MRTLTSALALAAWATASQSAVIVNTVEINGNLETTYSGTLDLSGLTFAQGRTVVSYALIRPNRSFYFNMNDYQGHFDAAVTVTGSIATWPYSAGTSGHEFDHTGYGDQFGFGVTSGAARGGAVYTAHDYVNGSSISGGSTTFGTTLADLGMNGPVTVEFSWSTDSIAHTYSRVSAVPLPAASVLLAGALGGLSLIRRRK